MQTEVIELSQLAVPRRSPFGEFLVEQAVLDRFQLQLQDRVPGTRLGHCAVVLGFAARDTIEQLHRHFVHKLDLDAELDAAATTAFQREPDIEIIFEPAL